MTAPIITTPSISLRCSRAFTTGAMSYTPGTWTTRATSTPSDSAWRRARCSIGAVTSELNSETTKAIFTFSIFTSRRSKVNRDGVANLDAVAFQIRLERGNRMLAVVNDRGDNSGVGHAGGERVAKMGRLAGAAGRDHRDGNGFADAAGDFEIVAELGAVAIDRVDAQLAGAETLALERPGERVAAGGLASAVDHNFVTGRHLGPRAGFFHLHREHDTLAAECTRAFGNQRGIAHCAGVDRNFLGAREQYGAHIVEGAKSAADAEGDENFARHCADHVEHDAAAFVGCGDVIEDDLVRAFIIVVTRHRDRVADVDVGEELDALGDFAVADIEARDNSFREHRQPLIRQKLSSSLRPAAPLFSRWN